MKRSALYYAGLILTIMGLIGVISKTAPEWSGYTVLGLGLAILLLSFIKRSKHG